MATTENKYTANGSDTQFVFTFPFLSTTDIKVSLNQVLTTAFTVTESVPTLITFNTAPANGVAVRIFRETNPDATLSRFFSSSSIPASDLNDNFDQALFINQELLNEFDEFVTTGVIDNSVTTSKIADGAVTTPKLADNNVTTAKITDANVTTAKIADANVTTAKIADANVTTAKILDSNVTADKIADANVTTAKIADANVTTAKVADSAITPAKLSIDYTEEAPSNGKQYARKDDAWSEVLPTTSSGDSPPANPTDGLIWYDADSGKSFVYYVDTNSSQWVELNPSWTGGIADDGVTTVKILDGAVTTAKIADNAVTAAKLSETYRLATAGNILQVVNATTGTSVSNTNTTYVDTTLSASITPTSASSKILVLINQAYYMASSSNYMGNGIRVLRGSTVIYQSNGNEAPSAVGDYDFYLASSTSGASTYGRGSITLLDSPNTTSATTYKTQGRSYGVSTVTYQIAEGYSTITLLEVAA